MPNNQEILKAAKEALDKALAQKQINQELIKTLGPAIIDSLKPVLEEIASNSKLSKDELLKAIAGIQIDVPPAEVPKAQVEVKIPEIKVPEPKVTVTIPDFPEIKIPEIKIPAIKVPKPEVTVNVPEIKIPELKWPKENMPIEGWVQLQGIDLSHPLPVQLRDASGRPVNLLENLTTIVGGGGGKHDYFTIKDVLSPIAISQVSGANWSVNVAGITSSLAATIIDSTGVGYSGSNPLPISDAGGSLTVDGTVAVSGVTASVQASIIDSSGVGYSGTNPVPIVIADGIDQIDIVEEGGDNYSNTMNQIPVMAFNYGFEGGTWDRLTSTGGKLMTNTDVNGITNTVAANIVDSIGMAYTGSNPLPVDTGTSDGSGKQLTRLQARDSLATAYVSLTTGTEATLLAATAGSYFDLIYIMGSNVSDVAATVSIRPVTAGNIVMTLRLPANGIAGVALPVPLPAPSLTDGSGNSWTADMDDITGTVVYLSALFSKEV